jgi:hypothetical protein
VARLQKIQNSIQPSVGWAKPYTRPKGSKDFCFYYFLPSSGIGDYMYFLKKTKNLPSFPFFKNSKGVLLVIQNLHQFF